VGLANELAFEYTYESDYVYHNPSYYLPRWLNPVMGHITSPAGLRNNPVLGRREFHDGIDIAVPVGTPVVAPRNGRVLSSGFSPTFGYFLRLGHDDGYETFYAHLSRLPLRIGDQVHQGERVAYSGNTGLSTGPHLHFGIFYNGQFVDPIHYVDMLPRP